MNGILLTTTSCPKCPAMKAWVTDNIDFDVLVVDETHPEFTNLLGKYGVSTAPTLIIEKDGKEVFRGDEDYEVEAFLKSL